MIFDVAAHVTILLILAFFILFAAGKADGFVKILGTVLGLWLCLIAILIVAACITAPMFGGKPFGMDLMRAHGGWMHHFDEQAAPQPAPPPPSR